MLLKEGGDDDDRRDHDDDQHRHVPPLRPARRVLRRDQHRHGLSFRVGEEEREQELVPGQDEHEHEGRREPGAHERQRDREEHPELRSAVDLRALLEIERHAGEEVARQPDDDRQVDAGVGRDQREFGVEQAGDAGTSHRSAARRRSAA